MQFTVKYFNKAIELLNRICGRIDFPEDIKNTDEKKILHISDTPDCIYPYIFRIIESLNPDIIIHTGDIVDNVKLGNGSSLTSYTGSLREILNYLEKERDKDIYIVPGNHDSVRILDLETEHVKLLAEGSIINIEGINLGLAHYPEHLPLKSQINLYGHSKEVYSDEDRIFLNGLLNINIILLPSQEIFRFSYPLKTDNGRKYRTPGYI